MKIFAPVVIFRAFLGSPFDRSQLHTSIDGSGRAVRVVAHVLPIRVRKALSRLGNICHSRFRPRLSGKIPKLRRYISQLFLPTFGLQFWYLSIYPFSREVPKARKKEARENSHSFFTRSSPRRRSTGFFLFGGIDRESIA